jgi:predicted nuclease of restriction endonuclease-like (RecB) superfamily
MDLIKNAEFKQWLADLKIRIRQSQIKAMIKVNDQMLHLYWDLGHDIVVRQIDAVWGSGFYKNLSNELKIEFPDMQGFSVTNLKYCKYFYQFYSQDEQIRQQLADEIRPQFGDEFKINPLFLIPWGHQKCIIDKCKSVHEALFYVQKTIKNGWSRAVLMNFIEAALYQSQGKSINDFDSLLPDVQSYLAKETLKDPYNFDFLVLTDDYKEKELEDSLVANITKFLLELGQGFAYVGRQYPITVGSRERNIDLLFYHLELRCYIVIELLCCVQHNKSMIKKHLRM